MKQAGIFLLLLVFSLTLSAQKRLSGIVTNGTSHQPAAGDEVILLKLGQGMEEEARTKTDSHGEFRFNQVDAAAMHLIRVRHDNLNYHEAVPPNANLLQITVYNAVEKVPALKLLNQSVVYQATGNELQAIELFQVQNTSSPAVTQPSFEIYLPEGASIKMAQAMSQNGMPTRSTVVPGKEKNKYVIMHPLRPGMTQLEVIYTLPYTGKAQLQAKVAMPADHFYVVTAQGMHFAGGGGTSFKSTNPWPVYPSATGVDVHAVDDVSPAQNLSYELAGTGQLPQEQGGGDQGQAQSQSQGQAAPPGQEDNRPGGGLGVPNEKPDPLHSSQWMFLAILTLFLAAGATYVYTAKPPAATPVQKPPAGPQLVLEAMKEEIFQLESERLQGRISTQEYESAKGALDKTLERAVLRHKKTDKAAVRAR